MSPLRVTAPGRRDRSYKKAPLRFRSGAVSATAGSLLDLYSLLGEILERAGVPGYRRGRGLLVLELEIGRFLVDGDQRRALVKDRLDDVIGGLVGQVRVRHQDVHHGRLLVVGGHAAISILRDRVLDVEV